MREKTQFLCRAYTDHFYDDRVGCWHRCYGLACQRLFINFSGVFLHYCNG